MADGDGESRTGDEQSVSALPTLSKSKHEVDRIGDGGIERAAKLPKPDQTPPPDSSAVEDGSFDESEGDECQEDDDNIPLKGEEVVRAADKGKGVLVEESNEDSDSEEDSSESGVAPEEGDESDLSDDPLAEVDLDNILPSRTRRRPPPLPGAYLLTDDDDDEDDDDDDDCA